VPVWDWAKFYDVNVDERLFEEYRPFTVWKHKDLAPYGEYVRARGLRWPVLQQADGSWKETRWRFAGFDDPFVKKGSQFDFYWSPTRTAELRSGSGRTSRRPSRPTRTTVLALHRTRRRALAQRHLTMRIPSSARPLPRAYVEMNREDARRLGVGNGDSVTVETRRGKLRLPAWIDAAASLRPGASSSPSSTRSCW